MRVGITTEFRHSAFSSGHANTSLSLATMCKGLGHDVILIYRADTRDWWDDCTDIKDNFANRLTLESILQTGETLDLIIESSFFIPADKRRALAKRCVWYTRKPGLFTDLEATVYSCKPEGRNLDGVSAIWTADLYTMSDDISYIHALYPSIPITIVPWIWIPDLVESHRKITQSPVWLQMYQRHPKDQPWSIHIAESNVSSTSSCTLPLVIMRHSLISKKMPISNVSIHNTDNLKANQFFNENILKHCNVVDLSYNFLGRQRIIDWVHEPRSVVLSHTRFANLKLSHLEAAWVGLPIIHNSKVLRDMGNGLEKLYYHSNSVTGAANALNLLIYNTESIEYLNKIDTLTEIRKKILTMFYPQLKLKEWNVAFQKLLETPVPVAIPAPIPVPVPVPIPSSNKYFNVLFSDMWDQFNESYNTFTLALEEGLKGKTVKVNGFSINTLPKGSKPDLVVFGPFGQTWKSLDSTWPKVHYTGENSPPVLDPSVKLNIGYRYSSTDDSTYLRIPLWQLSIDWFGADHLQIKNPLPIPIDACTTPSSEYSSRDKFCAFIVTNPSNPIRNKAFTDINAYKPVDSAGRLYNNIGNEIFAGLGGGGGELKKHEFLKRYRFSITYENSSSPGYTTEKLFHAKAAGCVPIYWGDPNVTNEFNEGGFINANNFKSSEELIKHIDSIESNRVLWNKMANIPTISNITRDLVRRNFAEMVRMFMVISDRKDLVNDIPLFIGAKTTSEANAMRADREQDSISSILFVTGTTLNYWQNLEKWLDSIILQEPAAKARVYVGSDVPESLLQVSIEKYMESTEFIRFPSETPANFSDFWDPKHYAWKLWIYNTVVNDSVYKGKLIFYMDVATVLVCSPIEWIQQTQHNGVSFLDDTTQKNRSWCHSKFCEALSVTEAEMDSNQIAACLLLFIAGHPNATKLFGEAYRLGCIRDIVVGEKWEGIKRGQPFGHRHDQSILSILSQRQGIERFPLDKVYCDKSFLTTLNGGQSVYVHRGNYRHQLITIEGVTKTFVVNLDRREDRLKSFYETNRDLIHFVNRQKAFDGKTLCLTPALARLFKTNDFFWKKAVMGCALSHLLLLKALVDEPESSAAYFILEDDARLHDGWRDAWTRTEKHLPKDWDVIYLGGVLPPNRQGFLHTLEPIAPGLSRVALNSIFRQPQPTRYFHFCTYAYVISKRGASKILQSINDRDGYWTSADHMMCNRTDIMNIYVLDPLVAGASQDDDPAYQTAEFNNFNRVDNFDSDLWNNDERFTPEEISSNLRPNDPIDIHKVFSEFRSTSTVSANIQISTMRVPKVRFVSLNCHNYTPGSFENVWLQELFKNQDIVFESVSDTEVYNTSDTIIIVLAQPKMDEQLRWLDKLRRTNTFKILHLSDEHGTDPIHMYSWPEVTGVIRMYNRPNLDPKVLVIPLGYHHKFNGYSPSIVSRSNIWSFAGTNWFNRLNQMNSLTSVKPNIVKFFDSWNDSLQLKECDYVSLLLSSKFIPCPRGNNVETYRFYEALECGCIPIFIDIPENEMWLKQFNNTIPFLKLQNWDQAALLIKHLLKKPEQMEQYATTLSVAWMKYKAELKVKIEKWLS